MRRFQTPLALLGVYLCIASTTFAQLPSAIRIEEQRGGFLGGLTRPYRQRYVPGINLSNTGRLEQLIRAGRLYLSAQDVIALALENNLDIEVQRYGPLLAKEVLRRSKSGGALRSIDTAIAAGPSSVSTTGLTGTGGGSTTGTTGTASVGSSGGIVTQLGPAIPQLDPFVFGSANFGHTTRPQSNTTIVGVNALTNDFREFGFGYGQSWLTGTTAQIQYSSSRSDTNSIRSSLNPFTSANLNLQITQNLLQGFGVAVNNRNIRVAKNNIKVTDLQFKQQLITTVSAVLDVYWDLVAFNEDVRVKQQALAASQKLLDDNRKQVEIGTLPQIQITQAEAEVASRQQDLLISQTNVLQQETILKNALSRNGIASPTLAEVHIVPLDPIRIPDQDNTRPAAELVEEALAKRPEIDQARINIDSGKINLDGSRNSLRPTLQAFVSLQNNALTGSVNPSLTNPNLLPDPYFVNGYSNALGQIFRRNFPDYAAGFSLNIPIRNRAAQADYATDQLRVRQSELQLQRSVNQVRVDVENAVIGIQQARARYDAAVKARVLQEQTLDAEQKKYALGASTPYQVILIQRDLATAQGTEVQALANYAHARVAFEEALGVILETNNVSIEEALSGHVARESGIPTKVPDNAK